MTDARLAQLPVETAFEDLDTISANLAQIAVESLIFVNNQANLAQIAVETLIGSTTFVESPPTSLVEVILDGDVEWTSLADDLLAVAHITTRRGIDGHGPLDIVASSGEATFALRNDARNSGSTAGWYSPRHADVRDGWALGIPCRVNITNQLSIVTVFRGRIGRIRPAPGQYLKEGVFVTAYDHMDDLFRSDIRELALGVSQYDAELFEAIYTAMSPSYRPPSTDFDAQSDLYPYAFDDLGDGVKAAEVFRRVAQSGNAIVFCAGDGALTTRNRETRASAVTHLTFDDTMQGLVVVTGTDKSYSRVRVTTHPRSVGTAAVVLFQETGIITVFPGQVLAFWAPYQDPDDLRTLIGGADIIAPVASTDYTGNALADGSGADLTADLDVTVTPFASTALVEIENTGAQDVYLVNGAGQPFFRFRGTPIYDDGERTFETVTDQIYGENPIIIDLPYQASSAVGQTFADFFATEFADPIPIELVEFVAHTPDLVSAAINREIGDRITVAETATGVNHDVVIQAVELELDEHSVLHCRWRVAPATTGDVAPPPPPPPDPNDTDVTVSYSLVGGGASGNHNLSQDGPLALTVPGTYSLAFNRFGVDIRVKGVGAGELGGHPNLATDEGGNGGSSGASNLTGVVVPLTQFAYECRVGDIIGSPTISHTGTAQAGGASTITLDVGASAVDDFYNHQIIVITAGTGVGQTRVITDYVGATKVATVHAAWSVNPASNSVFYITFSIPGATYFREPGSSILLLLTLTADVGAGGVDGEAGGLGQANDDGLPGASGVTGGGGAGGGKATISNQFNGGDGGDGTDQTGGAGGLGPTGDGAGPSPSGPGSAIWGNGGDLLDGGVLVLDSASESGGGGGAGGGVLHGGIYAGGGGGGAGFDVDNNFESGLAGQGVLTIELA